MLDEKGEIVAPNEFIPAAEGYGLITKIDCWLIETFFSIYNNLSGNNLLVKACIAILAGVVIFYPTPTLPEPAGRE
jgi:EAL domain-containing protein (putative c-di-GMP-specific phosphodiesterase class I)